MWGHVKGHPGAKVGIRVRLQVAWKTEGKMEVVATLIVVDKVKPKQKYKFKKEKEKENGAKEVEMQELANMGKEMLGEEL